MAHYAVTFHGLEEHFPLPPCVPRLLTGLRCPLGGLKRGQVGHVEHTGIGAIGWAGDAPDCRLDGNGERWRLRRQYRAPGWARLATEPALEINHKLDRIIAALGSTS